MLTSLIYGYTTRSYANPSQDNNERRRRLTSREGVNQLLLLLFVPLASALSTFLYSHLSSLRSYISAKPLSVKIV